MTIDATPARLIPGGSRARLFAVAVLLACVPAGGCASAGEGDADTRADPPAEATGERPEEGARPEAEAEERPEAEAREGAPPADPPEDARQVRPDSGTAWVIFGADTVVAEVAATGDARARGLQGRDSVPPGTGMLFVYPERDVRSFWMVNTQVALDIAFLDTVDGRELEGRGVPAGRYRVVDVQGMEPETSTLHTSAEPAVMALEVGQGWFHEHGVEAGDTATVVWGG